MAEGLFPFARGDLLQGNPDGPRFLIDGDYLHVVYRADFHEACEGMDEGSEIYLEDIFFEGDDLICQRVAREEELDGQSITYFWEKMGYNSPRYVESLKMDMVEFLITKEPRLAELLREYRYNFVFRFVGNRSRDRYDIKVSYNEIY